MLGQGALKLNMEGQKTCTQLKTLGFWTLVSKVVGPPAIKSSR